MKVVEIRKGTDLLEYWLQEEGKSRWLLLVLRKRDRKETDTTKGGRSFKRKGGLRD